jgi:hypothetical protein
MVNADYDASGDLLATLADGTVQPYNLRESAFSFLSRRGFSQ